MMPDRRRRWLLAALVGVLPAALVLALFLPFVLDGPPPEDSDLRPPPRPEVPDEENGFFLVNLDRAQLDELQGIVRAPPPQEDDGEGAEPGEDPQPAPPPSGPLDLHYDEPRPFTTAWDPLRASQTLPRLGKIFERIDAALERPHLFIPPDALPGDSARVSRTFLSALRTLPRALEVRMGVLLDQGRPEEALADALRLVRLGRRLREGEQRWLRKPGRDSSLYARGLAHVHSILLRADLPRQAVEEGLARLDELRPPAALRKRNFQEAYVDSLAGLDRIVHDLLSRTRSPTTRALNYKPHRTRHRIADGARALLPFLEEPGPVLAPAGGQAAERSFLRDLGNSLGAASADSILRQLEELVEEQRRERLLEENLRAIPFLTPAPSSATVPGGTKGG